MGSRNHVKKRIIFTISRMSIGGSQKSLVNALKIIDYNQYDVVLYVRENKTQLIQDIPKNVRVVVNTNTRRYEHTPYTLLLYLLELFFSVIKQRDASKKAFELSRNYIEKRKEKYEKKHYAVLKEHYDTAISYLQGFTCKFTEDCVTADKKICFFHNSTDALPEIHQTYLPKYNKIVVVSEETKAFLAQRYPDVADKLLVIKNLMDIDGIKKKAGETIIKSVPGKVTLCSCGRVSKEKGYDIAVEAARCLKHDHVDFIWYFVGDGSELEQIKQMIAQYGLFDDVITLGSQENPYPWISQCDIYVQPSYEEAQPLSIMEAQILLKPIVSTNTVGGKNVISDGSDGLLVSIDGPSVAEGIRRLIDHPDFAERFKQNLMKKDYRLYNQQIQDKWDSLLADS